MLLIYIKNWIRMLKEAKKPIHTSSNTEEAIKQ